MNCLRIFIRKCKSDDDTDFPHKLLLTNRQVSNLGKVFANR